MRGKIVAHYLVTYTRDEKLPTQEYSAHLACAAWSERDCLKIYLLLALRDNVRSVNMWRAVDKLPNRLLTSYYRGEQSEYWVSQQGEYEAVLAHEVPLELRLRGDSTLAGMGVSRQAMRDIAVTGERWQSLDLPINELGTDAAYKDAEAPYSGDGALIV